MKELLFCIALCGFAVGGYGAYSYQDLDVLERSKLLMGNYHSYTKMEKSNEQSEVLMLGGFGAGAIFTLGAISVLISSRKKQEEQVVPGQEIK